MEKISLALDREIEGSAPLYAGAVPLQATRHATAALATGSRSFSFASASPTIPVTVDEFERAALDYPILFFGPERRAVAVTGIAPASNLFVRDDGDYARGSYVPAYLRRYPFVLARDDEAARWIVCLDETSDLLVEAGSPGAEPLFADGQPTGLTREAIAFCESFEAAERRTEAFTQMLDDLELFEPRQAHYRRADAADGAVLLLDYVAVSRERLEALDDASLRRLHAAGALGPIYAHILSAANWDVLALRVED